MHAKVCKHILVLRAFPRKEKCKAAARAQLLVKVIDPFLVPYLLPLRLFQPLYRADKFSGEVFYIRSYYREAAGAMTLRIQGIGKVLQRYVYSRLREKALYFSAFFNDITACIAANNKQLAIPLCLIALGPYRLNILSTTQRLSSWLCCYLRQNEDMLFERGIDICHENVRL